MLDARRTQEDPDTVLFHAAYEKACAPHPIADYQRYKAWCEEYFFLPHRKEMRGVGGIFYDYLTPTPEQGGWDAAFRFTQDVGRAFVDAYPAVIRNNMHKPWTAAQREEQLVDEGAMWSSTCCTTAAQCSGSRRAATSPRSCHRFPRSRIGLEASEGRGPSEGHCAVPA